MLTTLKADQQKILKVAIDRIIPADDFPGAWEAGVGNYIDRQLAGDLRGSADSFLKGLAALDAEAAARFGKPIGELSPEQVDQLLAAVERGETKSPWPAPTAEFFTMLVNLTMEGYYADPSNGGNLNQISWKMIGYDPRGQVRSGR